MRNVFGIDITENKDNISFDGECFIGRRVSENEKEELDKAINAEMNFSEKTTLPLWLQIVNMIAVYVGIVITIGVGYKFKLAIQTAPYLLYICVIAWVTVIYLFFYKRSLTKEILNSDEFSNHVENVKNLIYNARKELGIPENCKNIDIIGARYKFDGEKRKDVYFNMAFKNINFDMFIFYQNGMVCLADIYYVYEIPIESIKKIEHSEKRVTLPEWHKEEPYNSPEYKKYKVFMNNQGGYVSKYYRVIIEDSRGDFEILIPDYDIDIFTRTAGINIE